MGRCIALLSQAIERCGVHPNYVMSLNDLDADGSTESVAVITPGLRVGIGDVSGVLSFRTDGALHLETRETNGPYEWAEISVTLKGDGWRDCRRIYVQATASSNIPVEIVPAVRLFTSDKFHDLFATTPLAVTSEKTTSGCVFELSPNRMANIERVDLQLFLSSDEHSLTLFDLSAAGTR
ncbi:hypothetical protein [uncultured Tateyamaria sp.]|uniref:hypothetical protein n=1 Tax=uncultured Tateyamaria sp. TaxID=455651 RepID=UPI00262247BE|nr:hypothetical protein [uncultured Tateyamaria sp.]